MVTIGRIDEYISGFAMRDLSESWDNDGVMLCGDPGEEVKKAVVCLELGIEAVKYAVGVGAQLVITHHPFIFHAMKSVTGEKFSEISLLMKNDVSVLSYHTRYDKAQNGVNDILAEQLELCNITQDGFLRIGELKCEMDGERFAQHLRDKLGCGIIKAYFEKEAKIKRVAVCGGAGKSFLEDASGLADAYVSADFSHETFREAKALGTAVFDAGHYFTENPAAKALCERLVKEFPDVSFEFFDVGSPYFTV